MLLTISATADYDLPEDTFLLLMVEPALSGPRHRVTEESLRTTPTPYGRLGHDALFLILWMEFVADFAVMIAGIKIPEGTCADQYVVAFERNTPREVFAPLV